MSMFEIGIAHLIVTRGASTMPPVENAEVIKVLVRTVIVLAAFAGLIEALQLAASA
ncbi:hypothetical protein HFO94_26710 [Rhizobium leguminosarum]|uniref:hypothetical protein n=1 Tax=Rhizobium TaxID=379 RepID=UPI00144A822F|nr:MULTISPECIES: hypothetical protein [Rhizobium]MBY5357077.1 hypothetical protein [Rhizobium leguminosarum]NNH44536.1 hypothetical protein [Rhizobium laguerreae]UWM76812.1 hypothetical protein N1937_06140 [Rhizobium leguminosarum bv. viciae]